MAGNGRWVPSRPPVGIWLVGTVIGARRAPFHIIVGAPSVKKRSIARLLPPPHVTYRIEPYYSRRQILYVTWCVQWGEAPTILCTAPPACRVRAEVYYCWVGPLPPAIERYGGCLLFYGHVTYRIFECNPSAELYKKGQIVGGRFRLTANLCWL
jgi:hypothetical protein